MEQRLAEPLPPGVLEAFRAENTPEPILRAAPRLKARETAGMELYMAIRMLHSALVDADYLDTEHYFDPQLSAQRGHRPKLAELLPKYNAYMQTLPRDGPLAGIRQEILAQCIEKAAGQQGFYSLTVPTGGGKTLSSLGFALHHAQAHPNIQRVIYAIPFTSIIEQNAEVFRKAVGSDAVLEHHSAVQTPESGTAADRAAENFDAPLVVTTNVQLFESLFSNKPSKSRKLHNFQDSVIILDEMQALPDSLLAPCLDALDALVKDFRATVVICTATQPHYDLVWRVRPEITEIIDTPSRLFARMRRTRIVVLGKLSDEALTERLSAHQQVLCIVNNRAQARQLYQALGGAAAGAYHLSTLMCAEHRTKKLREIRKRLKAGEVCRLISTSLIEAGVDIDFPVVYRQTAGLDSVVQAAGRCNRSGLQKEPAPVYLFSSDQAEHPSPAQTQRLGNMTLKELAPVYDDLLSEDALSAFFALRFSAGADLDVKHIRREIEENAKTLLFPFSSIAADFQMIQSAGEPLYIPFDETAAALLAQLPRTENPFFLLRRLQRYSVTIYANQRRALERSGSLQSCGGILYLDAAANQLKTLYTEEYGLEVDADLSFLCT
jgi:CRISPR-associated helicase Cas3